MEKSNVAAFLLGAVLAGSTATLAGIDDAKKSIRALAPTSTAHRVDLAVADDGTVRASLHFHGVLTDDAKAAGVVQPGWVVDHVACGPAVLTQVLASCPVVDDAAVPVAFK